MLTVYLNTLVKDGVLCRGSMIRVLQFANDSIEDR
jgi:hypothetical protein